MADKKNQPKASIEKRYTIDKRVYHIIEKKADGFKEDFEAFYPSVTSIADATEPKNPFLEQFKAEEVQSKGIDGARFALYMAAERGTSVHKAIEDYNRGLDLHWYSKEEGDEMEKKNFDDFEWKRICNYMEWHAESAPEFIELETELYSKEWGYAGTVDAIAKIGGNLVICDWKSGKDVYDKYRLQIAAYWNAYREMTGKECDAAVILAVGARTRKGWKAVTMNSEDLESWFKKFQTRINFYYEMNPKADFAPKRDLLPVSFSH